MANLRDKIQDLLKNTASEEVKSLCESFLNEASEKEIDANDTLAESLFMGLKTMVSKDASVAKLITERESYMKTKMDLETQISKNAAQRLAENWDKVRRDKKVNNIGTDNTLKTENINKSLQSDMLLEKLNTISEKDESVKKMVAKTKKDVYHVKEAIAEIKSSPIATQPQIKYVLARYENVLSEGIAEYLIVKDFLSSINPFKWDATVKSAYDKVNTAVTERAVDIEVQTAIMAIKSSDKNRFFGDLVQKMNEWVYSDNKNVHDLARDMKGYMFNPIVKDLANKIMLMENSKGTSFNIPMKSSNCSVAKVFSPVLETENGQVFKAGNSFYHAANGKLARLNTNQINALPKNYLELCENFFDSSVKIVDDRITVYFGKSKVQIFEDKRIFINEKQIDPSTLGSQLLYHTQANVFVKTSDIINKVVNVYENFDSICEIDYGKRVSSNVFEGVGVYLFKKDDKVYINKVNPGMKEDAFFEANAIQTVNLVKEFLSYDLSESLSDFLSGDYKKKALMESEASDILKNIELLEGELDKIENAILQDPSLNDIKEIQETRNLLETELNKLKSKWQEASDEIKKFETVVKEEEEKAEDVVIPAEEEGNDEVAADKEAEANNEDTEPAKEPSAEGEGVVGVGVLGAEGAQAQATQIPGNDHLTTDANVAGEANLVDAGFVGAEGVQKGEEPGVDTSNAIKQEFAEVPVVTPGPENGQVIPGNAAPESVPVSAGNEATAEVKPVADVMGDKADGAEAETTAEVKPEEGDKEEEIQENVNEESIGIDSRVKIKSRDASGVVTAVQDGVFTIMLDNGETAESKLEDLEGLEKTIEDNIAKNEVEYKNENQEGSQEGDDKDEPTEVMYIKATMSIDLGPFKQGDSVEVDASAYTAGGEDDPVKLKEPKDGVSEVPKKYLKLTDDAITPAQEMGDVKAKLESVLKGLEELETIVKSGDKINDKTIEEAKAKLKEFADALTKEQQEVAQSE